MKKLFAALMITVLMSGHADAAEIMYFGAGADTCNEWIEDRKTSSHWYQGAQWILGYISSYNYYGSGAFGAVEGADIDAMMASMDEYCADNPEDRVGDGVDTLIDALTI